MQAVQSQLPPALSAASEMNSPDKDDTLLRLLNQYWGYSSFRPGQEAIIRGIAAGRDACLIMPTGAGKSLCYQLPAVLQPGKTAIVISPLIALMQDQVAQLQQIGIPAALLNSSISQEDRATILNRAQNGAYRLLYLSPERIAMNDTAIWLRKIPISFFAIDEAHCISEWGHDFRPDYRQLSRLGDLFPDKPIIALTASATQRVRHDIIQQLRLREPAKHIASFRRENLRYAFKQCNAHEQLELLPKAVRRVSAGSIIIYSPTVARVGETVDLLEEIGIPAIGYHGQMDARTRRENQEKWMTDEVRVMVGTMAFGLGINKPAVRSVIHLALPKSIEQYYQESGRAGRDGLPADCLLLWQYKDANIHAFFARKIEDSAERLRREQRSAEVQRFVESNSCRQLHICRHFGESPRWQGCGICDACAGRPDWMFVEAPQRSSRRAARRTSAAKSSRNLRAQRASQDSAEPSFRYSESSSSTSSGHTFASRPAEVDAGLKDFLREWRRSAAKENNVPAFVIMNDSSLDDLCLVEPSTLSELRRVSGFGDKKVEMYGGEILSAIRRFREGERARVASPAEVSRPSEETLRLLEEGRTFSEIAQIRGRRLQAVVALVSAMIERGDLAFRPGWIDPQRYSEISAVCNRVGMDRLKPLKDALPDDYTYEEIRLVIAALRRNPRPLAVSV